MSQAHFSMTAWSFKSCSITWPLVLGLFSVSLSKVCWLRRTFPTTRWLRDRPISLPLMSNTWRVAEQESYPSGSCQRFCQGLLDTHRLVMWRSRGPTKLCGSSLLSCSHQWEQEGLKHLLYFVKVEFTNDFLHLRSLCTCKSISGQKLLWGTEQKSQGRELHICCPLQCRQLYEVLKLE